METFKKEMFSILFVDDDIMLLDMFKTGFSSKGYHCEIATTVTSSLELIEKTSFDIMIVDIVLPDLSGLELIERVKTVRPKMPIILMTGYIDDFPYDKAIEAGASDFIRKPFTLSELIARINNIKVQEILIKREKELKRKVKELEEFYDMAIGRELKMKQLKEEIAELKKELEKYKKQ